MKRKTVFLITCFVLIISTAFFVPKFKINLPFFQNISAFTENNFISSNFLINNNENNEITKQQAQEILEERFENYNITKIEYFDKSEDTFDTYNFNVSLENNEEFLVKIDAKNTTVIFIELKNHKIDDYLNTDECLTVVKNLINQLGFNNLQIIWQNTINDITYFNLAPVVDNVILYSDMLKVAVNCKENKILKIETRSYVKNKLDIENINLSPTLTKEQAKQKLKEKFDGVGECKLALVVNENSQEVLAYEIECQLNGYKYYAYVNAKDGTIENILQTA